MLPAGVNYVPTLAIRASEMNGLEQLPGLTKDRMRPLFLLAPWTTASTLAKAVERAEKAFPDRRYFLDLDRDYAITNPEADAQAELLELLSPHDSYAKWWEFVAGYPYACPCLQLRDQDAGGIRTQIGRAQEMGREFCLRIVLPRFPPNLAEAVDVLNAVGTADFTVILEGGWTSDPLSLTAQFSGLIGGALGDLDAQVPIVVSCTSMPKGFEDIEGQKPIPFSNRTLVGQIARDHNRRRIVYGDWGSTRPREPSGHKQRPYDRIDFPTGNSWIIARNRRKSWDFQKAAEEIVDRSGEWNGGLNVWGTIMILQTKANPAFGINTPQKNVAARVNIHLHRQAFFGIDPSGLDFDEDWHD